MIKSRNFNYSEKLWLNLLNRKINTKERKTILKIIVDYLMEENLF